MSHRTICLAGQISYEASFALLWQGVDYQQWDQIGLLQDTGIQSRIVKMAGELTRPLDYHQGLNRGLRGF